MFQFTHPVRGATEHLIVECDGLTVSIHAPRAGCDSKPTDGKASDKVSIHAPRAGCDLCFSRRSSIFALFQFTHPVRGATTAKTFKDLFIEFQFTHPVRGATYKLATAETEAEVSIHAPRAGCDLSSPS